MIYQLVKRDPSRKIWLFLAAFSPFGAAVGFWNPRQPDWFLFLMFWFITMISLMGFAGKRCTLFEAALPIRARDLFCARLLICAISVWLPVAGAALTILAFGALRGPVFAALIETGAILTLAFIAIQAFHIQRFTAPAWWAGTVAALAVFSCVFVLASGISPSIVLSICIAAGGVLLVKSWTAIPESFQLETQRRSANGSQHGRQFRLPVWMPIVRTIYSGKSVPLLLATLFFAFIGGGRAATNFSGMMYLVIYWVQRLAALDWLLALPIGRHKLFLAVAISPLGLYLLANLWELDITHRPLRQTVVALLITLSAGLVGLLASELPYVSLPGIFRRFKIALIFPFLTVFAGATYLQFFRNRSGNNPDELVRQFAKVLPANPLLLIATAVAIAGALYACAYWGFSRLESSRKAPVPQ